MKKIGYKASPLIIASLVLIQGCSTTKESTDGNILGRAVDDISIMQFSIPNFELPKMPGIYRADIVQGNIVEQEMIDQLKPGMSKRQVRFVMGSPLIIDPFHQERWDYFYSKKSDGKLQDRQRITLFFKDDKLNRIDGDKIPER